MRTYLYQRREYNEEERTVGVTQQQCEKHIFHLHISFVVSEMMEFRASNSVRGTDAVICQTEAHT